MNTGSIELLNVSGYRFLILTQINHDGSPRKVGLIEMPEIRQKKLSTQPRWKDGSYLTPDQIAEEKYQIKNHIS